VQKGVNTTISYTDYLASGNDINWGIICTDSQSNSGSNYSIFDSSYYFLGSCADVDSVRDNLSASYILTKDINCFDTRNWNGGTGFAPITTFAGSFEGNNHVISDLVINLPSTTNVGLFGIVSGSVSNLGLVNADVSGDIYVGGLIGRSNSGVISNVYSTGVVHGSNNVGGLVGYQYLGTISNSYSTANVTGNSYAVGGLAGDSYGTISGSYSTGDVSGDFYVGGLVGVRYSGSLSDSYSTSQVYASFGSAGGLVGYQSGGGTISNSYSKGSITCSGSNVGGLVGASTGVGFISSYWDTETSGRLTSSGGTGKTTAQMKSISTFSGWSIGASETNINDGYPYLGWQVSNDSSTWLIKSP